MMDFVRKNMVLVIIGAVAVLATVALGVVGKLVGSDVQKLIDERSSLSQDLRRQGAGELVSPEKLQAKQSAVEQLRQQADEVAAETMDWNRRNYSVLRLSAGEGEVPAFPIDENLYKQYSLRFKFMMAYNDTLNSLVEPLRVTQPPDPQQIESRAVAWESYLQERRRQEREDGAEQPAGEGVSEWERDGMDFERYRTRRTTSVYRDGGDMSVSAEARMYGRRDAVRQQAQAGLIYLNTEMALHNLLPEQTLSRAGITNELLWFAQVNLWVQQDILNAIAETNEQFVIDSGGDPDTAGVLDSAVKRLIRIDVDEQYYFGEAQAGTGRGESSVAPARGSDRSQVPTLTGRVTNELHEVIQYRFTVVMRPDQKVRLMEKLMSRNCHSVLEQRFVAPHTSQDSRDSDETLYDYGPDPVVEATFTGELLLLTPLTRGRWDEQAKEWSQEYPPLVPVEVLLGMSGALRQEDQRRGRESGVVGSSASDRFRGRQRF